MNRPTAHTDVDCIRVMDERWASAAARRDLDGMMAIYAPNGQELLPDMPALVGRDAIRRFYARLLREYPRFAHEFHSLDVRVATSGDLAVVRGTYRFTPDAAHRETSQVGKFVSVWSREGGVWRLLINASNGDGALQKPPSRTTNIVD